MQARLLLEDGTLFTGLGFGAEGQSSGEVVFNTGITGYQEVLSDPSYCGQIVTMTYPLIGNYGITRDDFETVRPYIHGFVVRRHEPIPSNWRAQYTLDRLAEGIRHHRHQRHRYPDADPYPASPRHDERPADDRHRARSKSCRSALRATSLMRDQVRAYVDEEHILAAPGNDERIVLVDLRREERHPARADEARLRRRRRAA